MNKTKSILPRPEPGRVLCSADRLSLTWWQLAELISQNQDRGECVTSWPERLTLAGESLGYDVFFSGQRNDAVTLRRMGQEEHQFQGDHCFGVALQFLQAEVTRNARFHATEENDWTLRALSALCCRNDGE